MVQIVYELLLSVLVVLLPERLKPSKWWHEIVPMVAFGRTHAAAITSRTFRDDHRKPTPTKAAAAPSASMPVTKSPPHSTVLRNAASITRPYASLVATPAASPTDT